MSAISKSFLFKDLSYNLITCLINIKRTEGGVLCVFILFICNDFKFYLIMKTKLKILGLVCVLGVSAYTVYSSIKTDEVLRNLMLENIEAVAESGMHGRPLLYNSDFRYKCGNCNGDDCDAVC